jgi:tetratricopeptide (TPR) repeat protein
MKAVVTGEIHPAGDGYILSAQLVAAESGEILTAHRESASDPDAVIPAVDRLSNKLREKIGESLRTIRAGKPLAEATTASMAALRKYTQALRAEDVEGERLRSLTLLEEATELDSTFAMAYRKIGVTLFNLTRDPNRMVQCFTRAYELRDRLPERERHFATATYFEWAAGEPERARSAYESLLEIEPRNTWALNNLGNILKNRGDDLGALELYLEANEIEPSLTHAFNIASAQMNLGAVAEAESTLAWLIEAFPENADSYGLNAVFAASVGRYDSAEPQIMDLREEWKGSDYVRERTDQLMGDISAIRGQLAEAEEYYLDRRSLFEDRGAISAYYLATMDLALMDVFVRGKPENAVKRIEAALEKYPWEATEPAGRPYLAFASVYAYAGDVERANAIMAEYERDVHPAIRRTELEFQHGSFVHLARSNIAQAAGHLDEAIAEINELPKRNSSYRLLYLPVRALAFESAQEPDSAIAAYERYIDTPDLFRFVTDRNFLGGSYLRLGNLYEERGNIEKAVFYYEKLVNLWRDADEDLQHRVNYARNKVRELSGIG